MRILEIHTEHTTPFKVLFEVLKDMLPEANVEIRVDKPNIKPKNKIFIKKKDANLEDDEDIDSESSKSLSSDEEECDSDDSSGESEDNEDNKSKKKEESVNRSGIRILAVDTTKTVLINMKLDAKHFETFKCKKKKMILGMNLVYFHKLIKSMDKDDDMTLFVEHDDRNYLRIKIDNSNKNKKDVYKLKLLDLGNDEMSLPDITFDAVVQISATEFHRVCREMNQIADFVEIKCLPNKIIFTCKGDYAERTTTYETDEDSGESVAINHSGSKNAPIIQGVYELKNLVLFGKCSSLCGDIQIYMKNNYPLVIKYLIAKLGRILLCLTPINDDVNQNIAYSDEDEFYSEDDIEFIS
jgi:proliferating cell nuclear antigen